jgi:hypothetical protein
MRPDSPFNYDNRSEKDELRGCRDVTVFGIAIRHWLVAPILPAMILGAFIVVSSVPIVWGRYPFARIELFDPAMAQHLNWDESEQVSPNGKWEAELASSTTIVVREAQTKHPVAILHDYDSDRSNERVAWIDDSAIAIELQHGRPLIWRWHFGRILHDEADAWKVRLIGGPTIATAIIAKLLSRASSSKPPAS